jgi:succinate dehydrogenase / fumarate reductase membrane anchor subunit
MHSSTKKWLFTKISSFILLPLMVWFIINFVSIYDENHSEVALFFTQQPSKIIFSIFVVFAFFFSALTISEIFDDYIEDEKIKKVANKILNLLAILIPLITIFGIYNLTV